MEELVSCDASLGISVGVAASIIRTHSLSPRRSRSLDRAITLEECPWAWIGTFCTTIVPLSSFASRIERDADVSPLASGQKWALGPVFRQQGAVAVDDAGGRLVAQRLLVKLRARDRNDQLDLQVTQVL